MSSVKVFVTGAAGYIGGDFLDLAIKTHPEWRFSCLIRSSMNLANLVAKYPNVRALQDDLDAIELIEEEAATANIIYGFANCDHVASANAITRGLVRNLNAQVHWIHTSGTGVLTLQNHATKSFGYAFPDEQVFDDWDGVHKLTSIPDGAPHRHVDKIVLAASQGREGHIKTAIVCPPAIYGIGRGIGHRRSVQAYMAAKLAIQNGKAVQVGDGSSIWHGVHIHDLSRLYLLLGEAALAEDAQATWNDTGYYFAENGSFVWGELIKAIAAEGVKQGVLTTEEVDSLDFVQASEHNLYFPFMCGTTSRGVARRAGKLLGWKPTCNSLLDEVPLIVRDEARAPALSSRKCRSS